MVVVRTRLCLGGLVTSFSSLDVGHSSDKQFKLNVVLLAMVLFGLIQTETLYRSQETLQTNVVLFVLF